MQKETKKCRVCGNEFLDTTSNQTARYCRKLCQRQAGDRLRKARNHVCKRCGKAFTSMCRRITKYPATYCSISCAKWKGGERITDHGYKQIHFDKVDSMRGKKMREEGKSQRKYPYIYEHIVIAERALGRSLKKGEVVHHINGNQLDNRNSNLLICDRKYHNELHQRMARLYQQEHFADA